MSRPTEIDYLVVGGGLFGAYAALTAARRGFRVLLLERETELFTKASVVNQARLHLGYHYPRSIATARLSNDHYERFFREHEAFANARFTHYYAVDRFGSLTDAAQFERFCRGVGIPARRIQADELFKRDRLEAVFETHEPSFDPFQVKYHYVRQLRESRVDVRTRATVLRAQRDGDAWAVEVQEDDRSAHVRALAVVNATYANLNTINRLFGVSPLELVHEQSEVVLFESRRLEAVGLTVMDGPFCSVMPYGNSRLHSLTSVLYTHHSVSRTQDPVLSCQAHRTDCVPEAVRACTSCFARPASNRAKMLAQLRHYLVDDIDVGVRGSLMTVKTKLASSAIDDSRPTEISVLNERPRFYCLFSGKINSIYEVEHMIRDV